MPHNKYLINQIHQPVPGIRGDIEIIKMNHDGREVLYFHDTLQYLPQNFALDAQVSGLLSLINGQTSVSDIHTITKQNGAEISKEDILAFVQILDEHRILYSPRFRSYAEESEQKFEQQKSRPPVCAASSYPADPAELTTFFDTYFDRYEPASAIPPYTPKALYAPHIDLRIGMESYVKSFARLKDLTPQRVVILATSHYAGLYPDVYADTPFIASSKTFELPLGDLRADSEILHKMQENAAQLGVSFRDRAHRIEHSIELHLILLRHLWNHNFKIVPILAGNIDDIFYQPDGDIGSKVEAMGRFMHQHFMDDEETFILISGDLAHIGKKFGDDRPAKTLFDNVKAFDKKFLELAASPSREELRKHMAEQYDPYRICGFPPLYTFLSGFDELRGESLAYNIWDEQERQSAVSYGSILYH